MAQGLVQTGYGQRSACKSHPQALPLGLPGLEQNGNVVDPGSLPKVSSCDKELAAFAPSPLVVLLTGAGRISHLLSHIKSSTKLWTEEGPTLKNTVGVLSGVKWLRAER